MELQQDWNSPVLISQPLPFVKAFVEAIDEARPKRIIRYPRD